MYFFGCSSKNSANFNCIITNVYLNPSPESSLDSTHALKGDRAGLVTLKSDQPYLN